MEMRVAKLTKRKFEIKIPQTNTLHFLENFLRNSVITPASVVPSVKCLNSHQREENAFFDPEKSDPSVPGVG